jgi:hypothetical protein
MRQGTMIISLDCEGKWGMADKIGPYHENFLTDEALARAYRDLIDLFDRYDIPATFAFVMAFTLDESERRTCSGLLRDVSISGKNWLVNYRKAQERGNLSGWHQPGSFDLVRKSGRHEIACHGFSHLPLDEKEIDAQDARLELQAASEIAHLKGVKLETFIYPRNHVGFVSMLPQHGYLGYREGLSRPEGKLGRVSGIVSQFNVFEKGQPSRSSVDGTPIPIPCGYPFNWRTGVRRLVPKAVTVQRWHGIMRRASERREVAHLWLHPHNIITGPETLIVLEQVLRDAAKLRDAGSISIVTQAQYCRTL